MQKRIMVVDDSRIMMIQMENMLKDTEYEIVEYCNNGPDAIARYEEIHPDFITMDILMPGMDGLETARSILEEHPEARIIMLSSLVTDDTIDEAKAIGTKTFLYKPFNREELLTALKEGLEN